MQTPAASAASTASTSTTSIASTILANVGPAQDKEGRSWQDGQKGKWVVYSAIPSKAGCDPARGSGRGSDRNWLAE